MGEKSGLQGLRFLLFCLLVTTTGLGCTQGGFKSFKSAISGNNTENSKTPNDQAHSLELKILKPKPGTYTNGPVEVSGTCTEGASAVQVYENNQTTAIEVPCEDQAFSVVLELTEGDGIKNLIARQVGSSGQEAFAASMVMLDTQAPQLVAVSPQADLFTQAQVRVSGLCESGLVVRVATDGTTTQNPVEAACLEGQFSATLELDKEDGNYQIEIIQADLASNESRVTRAISKDTVAPALAITQPAAGTAAVSSLTVSGTCETGLNVSASGAGVQAEVASACINGQFQLPFLFSQGVGNKTVRVSQSDRAGNTATAERTFVRLEPDADAPSIRILQPQANSYNKGTIQLSGSCENGLTIQLGGAGLQSPNTATCTQSAFSLNVTLSQGDGAKNITVAQTDGTGNTGMDSRTFIKDTVAPAVAILRPTAGQQVGSTVEVQGSCENGIPVVIHGAGVAANVSANCVNSVYSSNVSVSAGDGQKVIQVSQTDPAENFTTRSVTVSRDSDAPQLAIVSPPANSFHRASLTLTGTCETGLKVTIDGAGAAAAQELSCANSSFATMVVLSANDGAKQIRVSQADLAGNTGSVSRTFIKDTTAPTIEITEPAANTMVDGTVALKGSCESGLQVSISGDTAAPQTTACQNSAFSANVSLSAGEGSKTVTVAQTDQAGNRGQDSVNVQSGVPQIDGKLLYANNCSGCHDILENSTKKGRMAAQISSAIEGIPVMRGLDFLTPAEVAAIAEALGGGASVGDIAQLETCEVAPDVGRVTVHRLNRDEYSNTIKDLFGITTDLSEMLPEDAIAGSFHNNADALSVTPFLIEQYLDAAEAAVNEAMESQRARIMTCDPSEAGQTTCARMILQSLATKAYRRPLESSEMTQLMNRFTAASANPLFGGSAQRLEAENAAEKSVGEADGTGWNLYSNGHIAFNVNIAQNGTYNLTVRARGSLAGGAYPNMEVRVDNQAIANVNVNSDSYSDFAVQVPLSAGNRTIALAFTNDFYQEPDDRNLYIDYADLETSGDGFETGIRVALQSMLVSPNFLFRMVELENPDDPTETKELDGYELATRLSYFLWSSKPDDRLMSLAADNSLLQPATLQAEIERMLADPRAAALVDNFASQWLELHKLEMATPETSKFPEFNEGLRSSMRQETQFFLADILRRDLPITTVLTGDFSYVDRSLASLYGISGISGNQFQGVSLTGTQRRGVLGHASILTMTSNPDRTNIVTRGKWIMENLLCDSPPPPPADIETEIDPDFEGTLRQRLEAHRANPACFSCHSVMDPLGFGMENFNGIGKWRTLDDEGSPIDSTGKLPDGREFSGTLELTSILKADPKFSVCVSKKLMTYAIGRELKSYDQCTVNRIAKDSVHADQPFSHLIQSVIESDPFRKQRGDGGAQ